MLNNKLSKRFISNTPFIKIIAINIIIILSYRIGKVISAKNNYLFRGWLDIFYLINCVTLIILGTISLSIILNSELYSKIRKNVIKRSLEIVSRIIMVIVVIATCVCGIFLIAVTYEPEHIIDKQGKKIIAKIDTNMFNDTYVYFYEPVNIFMMKNSDIESEFYRSYDNRYGN